MFTAAQMQLIRAHCLKDFEELLRELSISADWSGDEYRAYEKIDDDLSRKLSTLMKSSSVIAGYTSLLKLGGIPYERSDVDSEILGKIVANKERILRGFEKAFELGTIEPPPPEVHQSEVKPIVQQQTRMQTVTHEEHITLKGPIILGTFLIVVGLLCMFNYDDGIVMENETIYVGGGVVSVLFGIMSTIMGMRGKNVQITKTVPVRENVTVSSQPVVIRPVRQSVPVHEEKKPTFTQRELQMVLGVLTKVDKITRAIR